MKMSKHYVPDATYQDRAGTRYTIKYIPQIRAYHLTRLDSTGGAIANATVVFQRWIRELKYVGLRSNGDVSACQ
jgi:hypothetical protein